MFEATDEERETEKRVTSIDTSIQSHETLEPWKTRSKISASTEEVILSRIP